MESLKETIHQRDFEVLLPLASTDVFTEELIHETVKNELTLIEYHYKAYKNETPQLLLSIIGNDVAFLEALVNNPNTSVDTLKVVSKSACPALSDYGTMKLAINKYNNR